MEENQPSATAMIVALNRAAHLLFDDEPHVFIDQFAWPLVGSLADDLIELSTVMPPAVRGGWRAPFVARARLVDDRVGDAVRGDIPQYVLLGAGLDSFIWRRRNLLAQSGLRVFEVDHPATQSWKRHRAERLMLDVPSQVTFVPIDFTAEDDLIERLVHAGFDLDAPAVVSWLGVTFYLTRDDIAATLKSVASLASGSVVCFDYGIPESMRSPFEQELVDVAGPLAEARGEPWLSWFTPHDMTALVRDCGLEVVDDLDLGGPEMSEVFGRREDELVRNSLVRLLVATVP